MLLEGRALSQPMLDGLAAAASRYTSLAVETSVNAANSDHVSFLDKGIPAVLTIEGADSTNDEIHSARDTLGPHQFRSGAGDPANEHGLRRRGARGKPSRKPDH